MAPSSQKNTKSVVKMWRGPLHAYHDGLRAVITEAAASGSLSGPSVRGPGGTRIFFPERGIAPPVCEAWAPVLPGRGSLHSTHTCFVRMNVLHLGHVQDLDCPPC